MTSIFASKRIGLVGLKMADGLAEVASCGPAITFAGIGLAAIWDPDLVDRMGVVIEQGAHARGVHFTLRPESISTLVATLSSAERPRQS